MHRGKNNFISAEKIRSSYFTPQAFQTKNQLLADQSRTDHSDNTNFISPFSSFGGTTKDLTPTAKYIIREAKRRLGQQSALDQKNSLPAEADLFRLIQLVEQAEGENLSEKERTAVVASITASLEHFDILTPLLENKEVNDIIIRCYNDISVQINRHNIQTDQSFPDHEAYKSFVENLLKRAGKSCTVATPVVDVAVDRFVRASVIHESFCPAGSGPMLTLRIARHSHVTLDTLTNYQLAPRQILDYLGALAHSAKCTFLVAGEVATGKTTLIKGLASRIAEEEAILIIEDTHELVLNRSFVRTLLTREANTEGSGRITSATAIRTGMRMAMNRIILGEMRDPEAAEAFIDVCASGHAGMSTIHARSSNDAIARLELFLARAQGNVDISAIRRQIANALSVVIHIGVDKQTNTRRIFEILEVGASSDGVVQVSPIFVYQPFAGYPEWKRQNGISQFNDILRQYNIELPPNGQSISFDPENIYRNFQHTT